MNAIIVNAGGPSDPAALKLSTRRGTHIRNERRREWHPDQLRLSVNFWTRERPKANLRSITALYNCMGLIFASRRTWIDPKELALILREDEFVQLSSQNEADLGDVVVYKQDQSQEVSHVAVIIDKTLDAEAGLWKLTVMSKWGPVGEYVHSVDYVPQLLGRPVEYCTDRRKLQ